MNSEKFTFRKMPLTLLAAGALAMLAACSPGQHNVAKNEPDIAPQLTVIPPGKLDYYPAGEYLRNGFPAVPPMEEAWFDHGVVIGVRQVSQAEYELCVADGACAPPDRPRGEIASPDLPVTGVSWRDATTYAQWLSERTGVSYRLPSYVEWVYAAGSAYIEDAILEEFDNSNPAQRWLAEYALETQRKKTVDGGLRAFGGFGVNEHGLQDVAGNVWEWTDTCHVRQYLDADHVLSIAGSENCGVRVVAGAHRSYIPDFIRDAKSGACSVGVPPSNLGFRLVRDISVQSHMGDGLSGAVQNLL